MLSLYLLSYVAIARASVNLEFQVDGNTSNSALDLDITYVPSAGKEMLAPPIPSPSNTRGTTWAQPSYPSPARSTHTIRVGEGDALTFTPDTVEAMTGDLLLFFFESGNHTLTQSSLAAPCKDAGVFDTGFVFSPESPSKNLSILVSHSSPMWFYCRQANPRSHCSAGMTFAVNPGPDLDLFHSNAAVYRSEGGESRTNQESQSSSSDRAIHTSASRIDIAITQTSVVLHATAPANNVASNSARASSLSNPTHGTAPLTTLATQVAPSNTSTWKGMLEPTTAPLVSRDTTVLSSDGKRTHKLSWIAAAVVVTLMYRRVSREIKR